MTEDLLFIKRGYIYEFTPKTDFGGKVFALAVSADSRCADNIVSIIILSPNPGADSVQIANNAFPDNVLWCNCGKVTSTERERLTREVSKVSDKKMQKIDNMIAHAIGINPMMMEAENKVYKELYADLLERLLGENHGKTDTYKD